MMRSSIFLTRDTAVYAMPGVSLPSRLTTTLSSVSPWLLRMDGDGRRRDDGELRAGDLSPVVVKVGGDGVNPDSRSAGDLHSWCHLANLGILEMDENWKGGCRDGSGRDVSGPCASAGGRCHLV